MFVGCTEEEITEVTEIEQSSGSGVFSYISGFDIGGEDAAEISAYDSETKKLFVLDAEAGNIKVLDFSDPLNITLLTTIDYSSQGAVANSIDISGNNVAVAIEAATKQNNGVVAIYKTTDYSLVKSYTVGALPDMLTYTPDENYILVANEGEPSDDYTNDPEGTISIINVNTCLLYTSDAADD